MKRRVIIDGCMGLQEVEIEVYEPPSPAAIRSAAEKIRDDVFQHYGNPDVERIVAILIELVGGKP